MSVVRIETRESSTLLTLDRPQVHNVLDQELIHELREALEGVARDEDCRVLVLTGAGDEAFCAGADLKHMSGLTEPKLHEFLAETRALFRTLAEIRMPTICAVNGHAHGGGAELACICDLRVGCESTTFRFPGLTYGMAVGTWHLPTVVGLPKAKELLFTAMQVDATESLRIGLLNRLVEAPRLLEESFALAAQISVHPKDSVETVKNLVDRTVGAPLQQRFFREIYSNRELGATGIARDLFRKYLDRETKR